MPNSKEYTKKYNKEYRKLYGKELNQYNLEYKKARPWFRTYEGVRSRCRNPKDDHFISYGAKGIKLLMIPKDFETLWFRDSAYKMERPSIDRINNEGNYELGNCRYVEFEFNNKRRLDARRK